MGEDRKPTRARAKSWALRLAAAAGLFVVATVVGHQIWASRAATRLARTLAELRAAGEPVAVADLFPDPIADDENASVVYRRAAAAMNEETPDWKRFDAPNDDDTDSDAFALPLTAADRAAADAVCRENGPALAIVASARGKRAGPWRESIDASAMPPLGALNPTRTLCRLVTVDAERLAADGDAAGAVGRLDDAAALADAAERRGSLVCHLVAVGMSRVAYRAIGRVMPTTDVTPTVRPAVVALLARLTDERPPRAGAVLAYQCERIFVVQSLTDVAAGRAAGMTAQMTASLGPLVPVFRPMMLTDAALGAEHLTGIQRVAATAIDWPAARAGLPTTLPAMVAAHPFLHAGAQMVVIRHAVATKVEFRGLANRRLAAVAVAARLYAADHGGSVPPALSAMVPAYLPVVPTDAMDGRPLRFAAGPPRAYSVGDDERDDGGVPVDTAVPVRLRHGDDIVYFTPQPRPTIRRGTPSSPPRTD